MFLSAGDTTPFEWHGLLISDHTAGLELSSSLATVDVPSGAGHPRAWSDRSEKYYAVMEGRVRFEVGERVADLTTGDVCIVSRGEVFTYADIGDGPARVLLVHTPPFRAESEHLANW